MVRDSASAHNPHVLRSVRKGSGYFNRRSTADSVLHVWDNNMELFFRKPEAYSRYLCKKLGFVRQDLFPEDNIAIIGCGIKSGKVRDPVHRLAGSLFLLSFHRSDNTKYNTLTITRIYFDYCLHGPRFWSHNFGYDNKVPRPDLSHPVRNPALDVRNPGNLPHNHDS